MLNVSHRRIPQRMTPTTEERLAARDAFAKRDPLPVIAERHGVSVRTVQRWARSGFEPRKTTYITAEHYRAIEELRARYSKRSALWAARRVLGDTVPKHVTKTIETYARRMSILEDLEILR